MLADDLASRVGARGAMVKKSAKNFHVKVAVRVRPLLGHDRRQQAAVEIDTARGEVLVLDPEKLFPGRKQEIDYLRADKSRDRCYNFDYVFDGHTTNDDVFDRACAPLADSVLNGFNATVFAYGQTGSGKARAAAARRALASLRSPAREPGA